MGLPKFKISHVTLTTFLSGVICHIQLGLAINNHVVAKLEVFISTG